MHNKINILGTLYDIKIELDKDDLELQNLDGYCNVLKKEIVIREPEFEATSIEYKEYFNHALTHETVHAFLYESGIYTCSDNDWALNEEIVDWIALQAHKIIDAVENTRHY